MAGKPNSEGMQNGLELAPAKPLRRKKKTNTPKSLQIITVQDNEPHSTRLSAEMLLTWLTPEIDHHLAFEVSPTKASLLLQIFQPTVCTSGNSRWICGNLHLTSSLLKCIPPDEIVEVRYIKPDHPFAEVQLPIHLLFESPKLEEALPLVTSLAKLLSNAGSPNQENLAAKFGVSQSTISRSLKKMDLTKHERP